MADEWAKPELGTGCVKITPAHDPNDYEVGMRRDLPMVNILNPDGTLNDNVGPYAGQTVLVARENVVADLDKLGLLVKVEDREIELAHSDRSKAPIEPLLTDQWFVKMDQLAQTAMDAVSDGRVKIAPDRYTKGYHDWLGEKRDWPISRQLWWGHQIPIWYAKTATKEDLERAFAGRDDVVWHRDEEYGQWLICAQEEDLAEDAVPGPRDHARGRRARHLVQLGPVAPFDAWMARADRGIEILLSDRRADHQPRHHHPLGRPNGPGRAAQRRRDSVP